MSRLRFACRHSCPVALFALLIRAAVATAQPAAFTDVTQPNMLNASQGEGVAWGDYDGDGRYDVVVAHEGGPLELFHNDGNSSFSLITTPPFDALGLYTGVAWGDYDNDGRLDLYSAEVYRRHHLFHNNGGGSWTDIGYGTLQDTSHTHGVAWADLDNDGDIDLFYATADFHTDFLFRNDGAGAFANITPPLMMDPGYGRGCSWADFDNDGDQDLCMASQGFSKLYRNDGGGTFSDATPPALGADGVGGGVAWGDYDNDGDFDLFVGYAYGYTSRLLRNDGGGVFTRVMPPVLVMPRNCIGGQWGDTDNDGDLDLYVGVQFGRSFLARNDGGGTFSDVTPPALGDSATTLGFGWCDYDQDGDLDLFLARQQTNERLVRNDLASGGHWLELDLVGTVSNRSAIGARVEVLTGSLRQIRRVDGGGGYNSQGPLRLHFGLGAATTADSIVIRWPSGIVQIAAGVGANQLLAIVEHPQHTGVGAAPGPYAIRLLVATPNPFAGGTTFRYELASRAPVRLTVHDAQGRMVRVLESWAMREAGRCEATWDGRDDAGTRVRAGVYFARLGAGGESRLQRIVRIE